MIKIIEGCFDLNTVRMVLGPEQADLFKMARGNNCFNDSSKGEANPQLPG